MSEANIAVIQKTYAAFNRGDMPALLAAIQPNAEWVNYGPPSVSYFGNFTGRISAFFQNIGSSTTGGNVVVDRYMDANDVVIAEGRYTATVRDTGARIDVPVLHLFTVRDGKITNWRGYGDSAAVAAAHAGRTAAA